MSETVHLTCSCHTLPHAANCDGRLIATLNAETAAGMQAALRATEQERENARNSERKMAARADTLGAWQEDALELLGDLDYYLDQRADYDMEGDPPRFVPNKEARLLYDLRELIRRGTK